MTYETCQRLLESLEANTNITIEQIIQTCTKGEVTAEAAGNIFNITMNGVFGGILSGFLIALGITLLLTLLIGLYIYASLAWYAIAKKLKHPHPWVAWIPIANWALQLQLGGFHWAWILLLLIPILGWITIFILLIIAKWFIYDARNYPGWFSLAVIIPKAGGILHLIVIGFVAWQDKEKPKKRQKSKTKK